MEIKAHILVVDDNCDLCDSIKEVLEEHNYFAECAVNGKEAIELARNNKYDIVLSDIKLTDISGNEVVDKIAEISPSTEFIYMTGHATLDSAVEDVKQKRVVSYEIKPLDLNHLLAVINQVIERKRAEEELKKSRKAYTLAQEIAHLGHWEWNIADNSEVWSDEQFRIFGYEPGDIEPTYDHFLKALHPHDYERVVTAIKDSLECSTQYKIEFRIIHP